MKNNYEDLLLYRLTFSRLFDMFPGLGYDRREFERDIGSPLRIPIS